MKVPERLPVEPSPPLAYALGPRLYLNLTSRCTLRCTFCPKWTHGEVWGQQLRLARQPAAEALVHAAGDVTGYREVVFCGLGEPTRRLETLLTVARQLRAGGARRLRLNTDGLANLIYGGDVTPELSEAIDAFSVSLNAPDAITYARLCPSRYGAAAYEAVCEFIYALHRTSSRVVASAVALPGLDLTACRRRAVEDLGVPFHVRRFKPPTSRTAWRERRR